MGKRMQLCVYERTGHLFAFTGLTRGVVEEKKVFFFSIRLFYLLIL